jgi:hypothetical protein
MYMVLNVHRTYTFALVYGDRSELARHPRLYTWAPICLAALMLPLGFHQFAPPPYDRYLRFALVAMVTPNGAWNVFHVFMQKYGLLRAYGLKLGYGNAKLEKTLILSWLVCGFVLLLGKYDNSLFYHRMDEKNQYWGEHFIWILDYVRLLVYPAGAWLAAVQLAWLWQEFRNFSRASLPKLAYAAGTFAVFLSFGVSILLGFIALATSHSLEYIAFVNIYGRHRPGLARWIRNPYLLNPAMIFGVVGFYLGLKYWVAIPGLYSAFMNCESYLHFLFDGDLWKLRDRRVNEAVLKMSS